MAARLIATFCFLLMILKPAYAKPNIKLYMYTYINKFITLVLLAASVYLVWYLYLARYTLRGLCFTMADVLLVCF